MRNVKEAFDEAADKYLRGYITFEELRGVMEAECEGELTDAYVFAYVNSFVGSPSRDGEQRAAYRHHTVLH